MPRLWKQQPDGRCIALPLDGESCTTIGTSALLLKSDGAWAILSGPGPSLRVNGETVPLNLRVLRDRDAIQLIAGDETSAVFFFSTDSPPVVAPLAADQPLPCARCQVAISPGESAVRCPACGAAHHQIAGTDYACWEYDQVCGSCRKQPTALDERHLWTPEELTR
jgi:hypothetical protein